MQGTQQTKVDASSDVLLDERSLATRWAISIRTLQNQRLAGRGIVFVKIGRSVRYRLSDIVAFESHRCRSSTSEVQNVTR